MTRLPREGANKTRLIPALGAKGAMDFHDRLARHAIARASTFCMMGKGRKLLICITGGTPAEAKVWLGDDTPDCCVQSPGDLGNRMHTAADNAFADGADKIIIIGTDCPGLDTAMLGKAEELMESSDLVFGPALDGGYYLIGMSAPCPGIFAEMPWGEADVLERSLDAAKRGGRKTALLPPLADVDRPEDIAAAEEELRKALRR